ncbi:1-acyl-sn-glycerol-3-phosphate acyltransferase [Flavobacterium sp. N1718]|uniref:1-acyl-sn-glycerol-3-phosphate acyltransferase n=1 Tax=Flavobacterium sp. N1718 TaxID=2986822 RepID=UPI0022252410|nr:1-acyl-sn-glycerol-3-phosphate acyltransferase [Flavobacterium sp. N1718]
MDLYESSFRKAGFTNTLSKTFIRMAFRALGLKRLDLLLHETGGRKGAAFIDFVFEKLGMATNPVFVDEGVFRSDTPLIIVANHPTGLLDGLTIIDVLLKQGKKVKVVVNYLLGEFTPIHEALGDHLIYVNPFDDTAKRQTSYKGFREIIRSLANNEIVVFFPAGDVSRLQGTRLTIRDFDWSDVCVKFIRKSGVPVVPVFIDIKNSPFFYLVNTINTKLGLLFVVREFFCQTEYPCRAGLRLRFQVRCKQRP